VAVQLAAVGRWVPMFGVLFLIGYSMGLLSSSTAAAGVCTHACVP
jgi:hypothetical protein